MSAPQTSHQFAAATTAQIANLHSSDCKLEIRQQPSNARVAVGKEKDRKPVDPPPIIQLKIPHGVDPHQNYLQSPYFFLSCSLVNDAPAAGNQHLPAGTLGTALAGTLVSSLHRLKDTNNSDGAFFVFGDLSVKIEGVFRLQFNLYQMQEAECAHVASITSNPFPVHSAKNFTGMAESTFLTRTFSDQGVRLRLRKEPRTLLRKRGPADDNYQPRTYNKSASRNQNNEGDRQPVTSPDSQDSTSQSQNEQLDSMTSHAATFEHRPALARYHTEQTNAGYSGGSTYEESAKRPRTGSDQSQASPFSHQTQVVDNSHYSGRSFSDTPSYTPYGSQLPQSTSYTNFANPNPYYASPTQSKDPYNSRDQFNFAPKINTQISTMTAFDGQRSPNSNFFSQSYTPSAQQFPTHMLATSGAQRVQHSQTAMAELGLGRMSIPPSPLSAQGLHSMAPPIGRAMPFQLPNTPRRESYPIYPDLHQNLPVVNTQTYPVRTEAPNSNDPSIDGYR